MEFHNFRSLWVEDGQGIINHVPRIWILQHHTTSSFETLQDMNQLCI